LDNIFVVIALACFKFDEFDGIHDVIGKFVLAVEKTIELQHISSIENFLEVAKAI
jgi:hypothetical protein